MCCQKSVPNGASNCVVVGGFSIFSDSVPEVDESYNLVRGEALTVVKSDGKILYKGIRGFMPLTSECYLVRFADKSWRCCMANGQPKQKSALCKKNLLLGSLALMFDERGKIRLGQQNVHYPMLAF